MPLIGAVTMTLGFVHRAGRSGDVEHDRRVHVQRWWVLAP
jgi:hypothetical protein